MTGRDKNEILFCTCGTEEASVMLERGKTGRNDQGSLKCCQDVMSLLQRRGRLILQLQKFIGYLPNLFITWDSIINVVLRTVCFKYKRCVMSGFMLNKCLEVGGLG